MRLRRVFTDVLRTQKHAISWTYQLSVRDVEANDMLWARGMCILCLKILRFSAFCPIIQFEISLMVFVLGKNEDPFDPSQNLLLFEVLVTQGSALQPKHYLWRRGKSSCVNNEP